MEVPQMRGHFRVHEWFLLWCAFFAGGYVNSWRVDIWCSLDDAAKARINDHPIQLRLGSAVSALLRTCGHPWFVAFDWYRFLKRMSCSLDVRVSCILYHSISFIKLRFFPIQGWGTPRCGSRRFFVWFSSQRFSFPFSRFFTSYIFCAALRRCIPSSIYSERMRFSTFPSYVQLSATSVRFSPIVSSIFSSSVTSSTTFRRII